MDYYVYYLLGLVTGLFIMVVTKVIEVKQKKK